MDAVVLAGGRSSRLGGVAKADLALDGRTLLERTVRIAQGVAGHVIVVGTAGASPLPGSVRVVREEPAFAGPVAGIAAGLAALPAGDAPVLVLACDMPGIAAALPALVAASPSAGAVVASDRGRRQPLAAVYARDALRAAIAALPREAQGAVGQGASMRALLEHLHVTEVAVPDGATDDVDTPEDVERFGVLGPGTIRKEYR